jgi:hypothetical protein
MTPKGGGATLKSVRLVDWAGPDVGPSSTDRLSGPS